MPTLSILIVDDHPLFRFGIRHVIEEGSRFLEIVEAATGYEALHLAAVHDPAIILVDAHLFGISGFHVAAMLAKRRQRSSIIMLAERCEDEGLYRAVRVGAVAYLPKTVSAEVLLETIDAVLQGEQPIHAEILSRPALASRVLGQLHAAFQAPRKRRMSALAIDLPLSVREFEVLDCIVRGYNNRDAAAALFINEQTVKNHMTRLLRKFDAKTRLDLLRHAVLKGWVVFSEGATSQARNEIAPADEPRATRPATKPAALWQSVTSGYTEDGVSTTAD